MSFFKRIFGAFREEAAAPVKSVARAAPLEEVPEAPRSVAMTWKEMLDPSERIAAYILRPVALGSEETVSGSGLQEALRKENVLRLSERCKVLLPMTLAQWQAADFRPFISANLYFLLADAPGEQGESTASLAGPLIAEIVAVGGQLALGQEIHAGLSEPEKFSGLVLLDVAGAKLKGLEANIAQIRQTSPAAQLAADGVGTWSESRFLQSLSVALCAGAFTTSPDEGAQAGQISESRLVVVEMLNLLRRDAPNNEIAAVAKRDPGVVLKLIAMANSPLSGLSRQVATLEDVILVLGRDVVYRWLALAMFRLDQQSRRDETLMVIALSRASFLESLAPKNDKQMAGELFLVGLFSLLDSLLRMPLETAIARMNLPNKVVATLLKRPSPYTDYQTLALAIEGGKLKQGLLLCQKLGLEPAEVWSRYSEAMQWATADGQG